MSESTDAPETALGIRFWGVRGSLPVPSAGALGYGGNTACIEINTPGRRIVLDAGTGIVQLGQLMQAQGDTRIDLLFSHLHHDHVIGLMAFAPCFDPSAVLDLYCGNLGGQTAEQALRQLYSPPLFPLTFDELPSRLRFLGFVPGDVLTFGDVVVRTCLLNHPGGAIGYRFEAGGRAIVVLTDVEHYGAEPDPALVAFSAGADLLVYDATFDVDDYPRFRGWGHSTWRSGADLAMAAGIARLACFHHAPEYDDARIARMEASLAEALPGGFFAREGQNLHFAMDSVKNLAQDNSNESS